MSTPHEVPLPVVGISGFDAGLSEDELAVQQAVHRFAQDVMRPIGRELDRMPSEEAFLPGSPFGSSINRFRRWGWALKPWPGSARPGCSNGGVGLSGIGLG